MSSLFRKVNVHNLERKNGVEGKAEDRKKAEEERVSGW